MTNTETNTMTDDAHNTIEARRAARMAAQNEASARIAAAELAQKHAMSVARDAAQEGRIMDATQLYAEALCVGDHPESHRWALAQALRYVAAGRSPVVGDVMVSSWGYEQTNVDHYLVTRATAKSVYLRKIGKTVLPGKQDEHDDQVVPAVPTKITFDKATDKIHRVEIGAYEDRHSVGSYRCSLTSYASASLWDGTPDRQTGWAYGH